MKIEIFKHNPGKELFFKIILDNGSWIVHRAKELTDNRSTFTLELDCKVPELAKWLLVHQEKHEQ